MAEKRIAFVGAGQMATALARGLVGAGFCQASQIRAHDPSRDALTRFAEAIGAVGCESSNAVAIEGADVILLAVKPYHLQCVAEEIREGLSARQLLVSIAAGVTLAQLGEWLGTHRVIRAMPNTPCLVGMGVSAFALGKAASSEDAAIVQRMMGSMGLALQLDEPLLDSVTGLSGSGPAYGFLMIEALADGGVRVGLPRQVALDLAAHTLRGAAEMVLAQREHPAVLKDRVTSPGGTTIAGLEELEQRGVRSALMAAVVAATRRAREMGCEK